MVFVITENNEVYTSGYNNYGNLGLGYKSTQVNEFTKVNIQNIENIYKIMPSERMTLIWYKDSTGNNTFYAAGTDTGGGKLSTGSATSNYLKSFTRIYDGNIGPDIDQDIKDILWDVYSVMILKKDGTIWQTGARGADSNGGGGDIPGSETIFKQFPTNFGTNVTGVYQGGGARLITRTNELGEVEVWGTPGNGNNLGLTDSNANNSNKYWQIPIPEELQQEGIKEIFTSTHNVYYLSNVGKIYVSGDAVSSGMNLSSGKVTEIKYSGLDNIQTMYSTDVIKIVNSNTKNCQAPLCFTGNDGKIYTTGNSTIVFGNKVLQKDWKLVATNVKYFDGVSTAYIDKNNNLYIAGADSKGLGLGEESETSSSINNYILHPDENIRGKVKKVLMYGSTNTYVLTTDGELLATGYYSYGGPKCYPGWEETTDKTIFVKLLENIKEFYVTNSPYGAAIAISNDGEAYGWGANYGGVNGQSTQFLNIPKEYSLKAQIGENESTKKVFISSYRAFLLTESGNLFKSGTNTGYDGGATATNYFTQYNYNITLEEGESIIDVVGEGNNMLVLTSNGRLFGYGNANQLGINDASTTLKETMEIPEMTDVIQITKGNGYYIVTKADGTVWATGSNKYGTFGRWKGVDRTSPNSRYRTSYEWVECPELEI